MPSRKPKNKKGASRRPAPKKKAPAKKSASKNKRVLAKKPNRGPRKITRKKNVRKIKPAAKKAKRKIAQHLKTAPRKLPPLLSRAASNPVIHPNQKNHWESKATFNAGAFQKDGRTHLLYRAIGESDISVLGYAQSKDGITMSGRMDIPAFIHKKGQDKSVTQYRMPYCSGGGWNGGCEDPRLTLLEGRVYLIFTDFDGWGSLRIAMTSIDENDFVDQKWNWEQAVPISPPGEVHKNWVFFPEKIKGKYAILHSLSPKILIHYFDDPKEFDGTKFIERSGLSQSPAKKSAERWDSWVRGAGPPPIKTRYGWLVLYHAMDHHDPNRYKLGAMILDLKDPTKILYRSARPILEPDEYYENNGYKSGVVYSCGAVAVDGTLFVYYGGADKVTCVATANLNKFLKEIMSRDGAPRLSRGGK